MISGENPSTWLCIDTDAHEFYIVYEEMYPKIGYHFLVDYDVIPQEKEQEILTTLNSCIDDVHTIYDVVESNPFFDGSDHSWFVNYDEAEEAYNELVDSQGGRSSYDDDEGGMDYSLDSKEVSLYEFATGYAAEFSEILEFATKTDDEDYE